MFIKVLTLTCFISVAFAAPAPSSTGAESPALIQPALPIYLPSQQLLRVSPNVAVFEKPSVVYSYPQIYSMPMPMSYYLLRQQGVTGGGEFADQVQDYFGMFGSQFQDLQNQSQGYFEDLQGNLQSSFGQGFELISQGFAQGFEQVNQGWGDIQQQWAGGSKSQNLGDKSGAKDESKMEKIENNKLKFQPNLLLSKPISLRYFDNRFLPFGFVRYGLAPLNVIPLPLQKQQELKPAEQILSRSNEEVKMEKAEEPMKSEPEKVENEKPQQ